MKGSIIMYEAMNISDILGKAILYAFGIILSILGFYGKQLITRYLNDKTKRSVAKTVVSAVEQLYKDLNGTEKYSKAVRRVKELLDERGITIGELEVKMLIEAAVNDLKSNLLNGEIIDSETFLLDENTDQPDQPETKAE